jgi:phosphatidylserine/phosphatidylglycerophosphate/cardiolipin synthase-like enzyme
MNARRWAYAALIAVFVISILGCDLSVPLSTQAPLPPTIDNPTVTSQVSTQNLPGWLKIYFTDPNPPDNLGYGIDQYVVPVLNAAQRSIDVTSFDLNLPSVINALASASQRGVKVRVVYDGENGNLDLENDATNNKPFDAIKTLKAAKVSLVNGGRSSGLMHDKMIIVDGQTLFVGSWNISYNDTYRNNNNLLVITEPRLIANYQAKFDELFIDKHFGAKAQVIVPNPSLAADGVQVENYFAPEDDVMAKLVSYVQGATKSVHYMIYTFTHADLSAAMIARAKSGVEVLGVIENRGASQGALPALFCAGLAVRTDGNPYTMHHKVIIIDGQTVITGSFNFTKSADTVNDDNVLVIHSQAVAALYEQEFQKIYGAGETPQAADITCGK